MPVTRWVKEATPESAGTPSHQTPRPVLVWVAWTSEGPSPPVSPRHTGRKDRVCVLDPHLYIPGKKTQVSEDK